MRTFLLCCIILASLTTYGVGFVHPNTARNVHISGTKETEMVSLARAAPLSPPLRMALKDDDNINTRVDLMEVDAFTLTAVGFGLIAFNFLVLANLGDAGIGGIVARIMNTFG